MNFLRDKKLSQAASDLIAFDADSIRQVVSSQHLANPDVWLVDPDAYEKNGRVLRDSDSPRMLAYSRKDNVLYATDGCNSCAHFLDADLKELDETALDRFSTESHIQRDLLDRMVAILKNLSVH